jgi:hypothetical protein
MHIVWNHQNNTPGKVLRSRFFWVAKWYTWNFARQLQSDGDQASFQMRFLNYWNVNLNAGTNQESWNDRLTRGGPLALNPRGYFVNTNANTDGRKVVSLNGFITQNGCDCESGNRAWGFTVNYKPSSRLTVNSGPQWNHSRSEAQYIRTVVDATATNTYGSRYVFGGIEQRQLTLQTRVTALVTPRLSVTLFAQPLIATGDYQNFKELAAPRTFDFVRYGTPGHALALDGNTYTVSPDEAASAPTFTFANPDFNLTSLRVNAVMRWEPKPGSALYVAWTRLQDQRDTTRGDFALGRDLGTLFGNPGNDVLLVKMTYWIGR